MTTFKNLAKKNRDRIIVFNEIHFNLMQFNNYLQHCSDIRYVCDSFDKFLNTLLEHETENSKNSDSHLESN